MPKTRFIRKACTLDEVRERTQWLERYCGEQPLDRYYVAKEIQLQENDFFELCDNLLVDRDWVAAFSNRLYPARDGAVAAIRVTCKGSLTVLIVDPQGYDYPRYVGLGKPQNKVSRGHRHRLTFPPGRVMNVTTPGGNPAASKSTHRRTQYVHHLRFKNPACVSPPNMSSITCS